MESGTLAEWNVKEGDSFIAGDSLAKIDTDKASIDFEAQDDGHVAKLLVPAGSEDVAVGTPIMVTVEEADDIVAFADFVVDEAAPAPVKEEPAKFEAPAVAATPPPPSAAAKPSSPPSAPPPPPAVEEAPVVVATEAVFSAPTMGPAWGSLAKVNSPLAKTLAAEQQKYVEQYGTTGQIPL